MELFELEHIPEVEYIKVGGKAAQLSKLMQVGINVPSGFVISGIANSTLSETEILTIYNQFDALGAHTVAVRSSASVEDGTRDSWAGQFDSFLSVTREQLIDSVTRCLESLKSPKALAYAKEKGISIEQITVAVVIQTMIEAEISGVAFSVHPVTEDDRSIYIEAVRGSCEQLVSGSVTPESYTVHKLDLTYERVPSQSRAPDSPPLLSDDLIRKLSNTVTYIERHMGYPCDIEWVYAADSFFIVQCRPITTLNM